MFQNVLTIYTMIHKGSGKFYFIFFKSFGFNLIFKIFSTSVMKSLQPVINSKPSVQVSVDYEPCLRAICRSELFRQEGERKGSRFYHHLRFMSKSFSGVCNEFQKRVCTIFQENSEIEENVFSQDSQNLS